MDGDLRNVSTIVTGEINSGKQIIRSPFDNRINSHQRLRLNTQSCVYKAIYH